MTDISNLESITGSLPEGLSREDKKQSLVDWGSTEETGRHGSEGISKATTGGRGQGRSKVRLIVEKVFNGKSV